MHIKNDLKHLQQIVYGELVNTVTTVMFENCKFYCNDAFITLKIEFSGLCMHPPNVTIKSCDFIDNDDSTLYISHLVHHCKANIFLNKIINFANNKVVFDSEAFCLMHFDNMAVNMNGTITVLENDMMVGDILLFYYCDLPSLRQLHSFQTFVILLFLMISKDLLHIKVMNNENITFINTTYRENLIAESGFLSSNINVYLYCIFQYMATKEVTMHTPSELIGLYTINFSGNDNQSIPYK